MPSRRLPSVEEAYKLFKADPHKRLSEWAKEWDCSHERVRQLREEAGFPKISEIDYRISRQVVERIRSGEYTLTRRITYADLPIGYEKFVSWYEQDPAIYLAVLEAQQWARNQKLNPTEKTCEACGENLSIENFKRSSKYLDGYSKYCKDYPNCKIDTAKLDQIDDRRSRLAELKKKLEN